MKEFERACQRLDDSNFDELAERDRVLVTIWALEADVNNGGFEQYYFNSSGDTAFFAPEALRIIGAHRMAAIVARANSLFGENGPPKARSARQERLFELTSATDGLFEEHDAVFYEYLDDISALLVAYLS